MFWILIGLTVVLLAYKHLIKPHSYWRNKGAPQTTPVILFGSIRDMFLRNKSFFQLIRDLYNEAGTHRYYGVYQGLIPTLLIKDIELIKQLAVKDFDHFQDHRTVIPEYANPLWAKSVFALKGQRWKEMRATLTPSFTNSKMRTIFLLISEVAENYSKYFTSQKDEDLNNIELKDLFTRFANDVIASVAFGIKCDSVEKRDNQFYLMGKSAIDFISFKKAIKLSIMMYLPSIAQLFRIKLFDDEVTTFFQSLIKRTIEAREKNGIVRQDMIHLLMEARKHGIKYDEPNGAIDTGLATVEGSDIGKSGKTIKHELTDEDITAQGFIFYFAGFDTVSSAMSFMIYELVVNPDIQDRLRKEIDDTLEDCNGKLTNEVLSTMKYLDMVISESLRKWTVDVVVNRIATKPYVIQPTFPDENPLCIDKDDIILIPIAAINRDPKYYPNPDTFDPERFNDDNKGNIKPYTYLPFGVGPRNCIGSRFALLEVKTLVVHLLSHFHVQATEKTQIPLKLSKKSFTIAAENGIYVQFKKRQTANE